MSEPEAVALGVLAQRVAKVERDLDYPHKHRRSVEEVALRLEKVESLAIALRNEHIEYSTQMRIVTDGYETIIHEVRETRASVETLFQRQAAAHLSAVERHSGVMKWLGRGVLAVTSGVVVLAGIQAILTGETLPVAIINLLRSLFG